MISSGPRILAAMLALALGASAAAAAEARRAVDPARLADGLRACPDGGVALPGSRTCVRLSGSVAAGMSMRVAGHGGSAPRGASSLREQLRGHVAVDVRTPTELGPLRVYTSLRVHDR